METGNIGLDADKQSVRREITSQKKLFSEQDLQFKSELICSKLVDTEEFTGANVIALYFSKSDEVRTEKLLEEWKNKKEILLPSVSGNNIDFYKYEGITRMKTGAFGIKEPDESSPRIDVSKIDLFVAPGVAFDLNRNRLGRGKGFYDRLLSGINKPIIGLCFGFQLKSRIPASKTDVKMSKIITEDIIL
jgi:5-formyltetrahydrofolate cyclo-ligase